MIGLSPEQDADIDLRHARLRWAREMCTFLRERGRLWNSRPGSRHGGVGGIRLSM